jgi:mannose/cellobiose epimerase-like protein (N-acyl-D-glucosamine 2-epimerase family)
MRDAAERMFAWAIDHGVDAVHGGIFNQVDPSGMVLEDGKRIWPVGECIKACVTRARRSGSADDEAATSHWSELLQRAYLKDDGSWHEHLDRTLAPVKTILPASTGYHLMTALLEIEKTETDCGVFVSPKA